MCVTPIPFIAVSVWPRRAQPHSLDAGSNSVSSSPDYSDWSILGWLTCRGKRIAVAIYLAGEYRRPTLEFVLLPRAQQRQLHSMPVTEIERNHPQKKVRRGIIAFGSGKIASPIGRLVCLLVHVNEF